MWITERSAVIESFYSFPGLGLNQIGGTSFGKALGEWNSPPMRFRRVGSTWLYANWARLSLFASGLVTNFGNSAGRQEWVDVGAQVDFRVVLFTYLNTTLSGGYAGATDGHGHISTEYMISLKIL